MSRWPGVYPVERAPLRQPNWLPLTKAMPAATRTPAAFGHGGLGMGAGRGTDLGAPRKRVWATKIRKEKPGRPRAVPTRSAALADIAPACGTPAPGSPCVWVQWCCAGMWQRCYLGFQASHCELAPCTCTKGERTPRLHLHHVAIHLRRRRRPGTSACCRHRTRQGEQRAYAHPHVEARPRATPVITVKRSSGVCSARLPPLIN